MKNPPFKHLLRFALATTVLASCYKMEDQSPNYEDGKSTLVYDLPGDTLASDGWENAYETGDTYLRQRFYNSRWTDSIQSIPKRQELINAAVNVDENKDENINWLPNMTNHPSVVKENDAYRNTVDKHQYLYRSGTWYQMDIVVEPGETQNKSINWRGYIASAPSNPQLDWVYGNNRNGRIYQYTGKAWALMTKNADYNQNKNFIQIQHSKSGKETGKYSMFIFRFRDGWQQFIRDAADSARYLKNNDWDIAFTGDMNSHIWLNNAKYNLNPGFGGAITKSSLWVHDYGYDFMQEAPEDIFFDAKPAQELQISYTSQFGPGVNPWYEYGTTFIAKPFPYKAFYLRLQQKDPNSGETTIRYGKLQLISMYKGAPEALTDRNWPSPYLTFRYFIQQDGSRNLRTKD